MTRALGHLNRNRRSYAYGLLIGSVLVAGVGLLWESAVAELKGPQGNDRFIEIAVCKKLQDEHLTKHPLDAEISHRCFKGFLKSLDSMKLYFTHDDFAQFQTHQDELAEKIRHGDISFSYTVFQTLLKRIDERMKLVDQLLAEGNQFDFDANEEITTDPDKTVYATTDAEMRDKWVKRIKYDLLQQEIVEKTPAKEIRGKLLRRYHSFAKRMHQINSDELLEMYLTALTTSFDPHTTYMSASTLENFQILMKAELDGIGASLQFDDGNTVVNELIDGGAAQLDGRLKPKDRVIGVGQGENGEIVDVVDMSLNDVVKLIRGKRGSIVRLKVQPVAAGDPKIYNITRAKIELKNSECGAKSSKKARRTTARLTKSASSTCPASTWI